MSMLQHSTRAWGSPSRYIQGRYELENMKTHTEVYGRRVFFLIDVFFFADYKKRFEALYAGSDSQIQCEQFGGQCTEEEILRCTGLAKALNPDVVVGIGGGKILDTAKAVAHYAALPAVIVPTVASTDSPCSSLSVVYLDNGEFDHYLFLNRCPDMVVVDTAVVAKAPVALLVAGMGDAMATYFEARACRASGSDNQTAGKPTRAATGLAAMCWQYLQRDGLRAKIAVEAGACTEAVETIVEVNTYLSSVGFESGGLAAAHAIQKGFTFIPQLHDLYHGNKVAFCTLVQLVMEDVPKEELESVLKFCCDVGLPVCFSDMGYVTLEHDLLRKAAEKACVPGATIHNMPFTVTPEMVYQAMLAADALGRCYHASC